MLVTRVLEISKLSSLGNCETLARSSLRKQTLKTLKTRRPVSWPKNNSLESRGMLAESKIRRRRFSWIQLLLQSPLTMSGCTGRWILYYCVTQGANGLGTLVENHMGFLLDSILFRQSVFMPVPHCSDDCSFVISSEIRKCETSNFAPFLFSR